MNSAYASQILSDKSTKLNNSQQSIETLSHWCIFYRKKAKQVVETWEEVFVGGLDNHAPWTRDLEGIHWWISLFLAYMRYHFSQLLVQVNGI